METLVSQVILLAIIIMVIIVACTFQLWLRRQMEGRNNALFSKEIDYEIYYQNELVKEGVFQIKNNDAVRFGFSGKREFFNSIVLENYIYNIEDLDEDDVQEMEKHYSTWFSIKMSANQMWITPAYSQRENRKGHKTIYIDEKILENTGEKFDGGVTVYSKADKKASFKVIIYDRFEETE